MSIRGQHTTVAILLTGLIAGCSHVAQAPKPAAGQYTLTLRVEGVRSATGQLRAELLGRSRPDQTPARITFGVQDAAVGSNVMTFPGLSQGEYAVQLYHDENGNDKVDMNVMGLPLEGFGFSNVPLVQGGIPPFDQMKVVVSADASATAVLAYAP